MLGLTGQAQGIRSEVGQYVRFRLGLDLYFTRERDLSGPDACRPEKMPPITSSRG
jgi:hypothetical protein